MNRALFSFAGAVVCVAALGACQLLADIEEKTPAATTPADAGTTSEASTNTEAAAPRECTTNKECVDRNGRAPFICVRPEYKCVPLLNESCDRVIAARPTDSPDVQLEIVEDDNTIFFGLIQDLRGANKNSGIARRNAAELAVGEIHSITRGIPGGADGKRRPIAIVACSETIDAASPSDPKVPSKHLIDDLHVPAIIGASNSETTTDLVNGETIPKKTLLFSSNAIAGALSTIQDDGLFWRTAVSATVTAKAAQREVEQQEAAAIGRGAPTGDIKLAFAYIGDAFGKDIAPLINAGLKINGKALADNGPLCTATPCAPTSHVFFKEYAATPTAAELLTLGSSIASFGPHIALLVGRKDAVTIMTNVEASLASTASPFLPEYQFTQGSATSDLIAATTTTGLRSRVRGTRPLAGANEPVFKLLYDAAYPQPANPAPGNGVPGIYDIVYLLSYAALAAPGATTDPLTGARLNLGLKRVLGGPTNNAVDVGVADVNNAFNLLISGQDIKVKGVSYNYDFDVEIGEAPNQIDVFCVTSTGNTLKASGSVFDPFINPPNGQLTGTFACPAN